MRSAVFLLCLAAPALVRAADGDTLFKANCAFCHGTNGQGGRGSNLTGQLVHGDSLDAIKRAVARGIPGTGMPAFGGLSPEELTAVSQHVQSFSRGQAGFEKPVGDVARGQAVYGAQRCAACHQIGSEGSVYGPELTRIGAARSLAYLRESIVAPSKDIPREWEGVAVTGKDGRTVRGVRVNEDTFSVQLRTMGQDFRMFRKEDAREVKTLTQSLMPAYPQLASQQLDDLLAYLHSLRGPSRNRETTKDKGGIQ